MSATMVVARQEKPLSVPAKVGLMTGLALLNLLFYLFGIVALLWIGLLMLTDVVLLVGLARFYAARVMVMPLRRLTGLATFIVRSFRLEEGDKYHSPIREEEAPHLFATVRNCATRVGCPMPTETVLEMTSGAWVLLEGVRSGRGKCTLGLGLEMLTTLPQAELEAVLLHEMAHALRVQRGLKKWVVRGLSRCGQLAEAAEEVEMQASQTENGGKATKFWTARMIGKIAGGIARSEARLFAGYSRQDEFEADEIAARTGGAQTFCDALVRSHVIGIKSGEMRWPEIQMQSQREGSFTQWLRTRLLPENEIEAGELRRKAFEMERSSPFSTHPTLQDRLAHVGADFRLLDAAPTSETLAPAAPVAWFTDADAMAERLITTMERVRGEAERRESEELVRGSRRQRGRVHTTTQVMGIGMGIFGVLALVAGLVWCFASDAAGRGAALPTLLIAAALLAGAFGLYRVGAPTPPSPLPAPEYTIWEDSLEAVWKREREKKPAPSGGPLIPGPPVGARKLEAIRHWRERGYESLLRCDYPSVLACGQQCLALQPGEPAGLLLAGIAYNGLGQEQAGDTLLRQAVQTFRNDGSIHWAAAWASLISGDWAGAELFLLRAVETRRHPTLLGALALAQSRRGKLRSACDNLRQAVELEPESSRLRLRLAQTLLMAGKARESAPHLEILARQPAMLAERDVRLALVRMHLMLNHVAAADAQAELVEREHPQPETFLRLGVSYVKTEHPDRAEGYFHRATATALYPAAWLYLGSIYSEKKRVADAHACFLGAVNVVAPRVSEDERPLDALEGAVHGIRSLRAPVAALFFWGVTLDLRSLPAFQLATLNLLVLAPTRDGALGYVNELYTAMHPGAPPLDSVLRSTEKVDMEPPTEATEPGIVDWRATPTPA